MNYTHLLSYSFAVMIGMKAWLYSMSYTLNNLKMPVIRISTQIRAIIRTAITESAWKYLLLDFNRRIPQLNN